VESCSLLRSVTGRFQHMDTWNVDSFRDFLFESGCVGNGRYARAIGTLREIFEPSDVLIALFDEIVEDPLRFIRAIEAFLDLPPIEYDQNNLAQARNLTRPSTLNEAFLAAALPLVQDELRALEQLRFPVPPAWEAEATFAQLRRN